MEFDGEPDRGALYCLDTDGTVTRKFGNVTISNGIVWSLDQRTMYYIDTGRNNVRAYDYDVATGAIGNERVTVTNAGRGHFDGMTMDAEGMVWIAIFGGSAVRRYDPDSGALLDSIDLPMSQITSCAFGGAESDRPVHHLGLPAHERKRALGRTAGRLTGKGRPRRHGPPGSPVRRLTGSTPADWRHAG